MNPESSPNLPRHVQKLIKTYKDRFEDQLKNIALALASMARKDTVDSSDVEEAYRVIWAYLLNRTPGGNPKN